MEKVEEKEENLKGETKVVKILDFESFDKKTEKQKIKDNILLDFESVEEGNINKKSKDKSISLNF